MSEVFDLDGASMRELPDSRYKGRPDLAGPKALELVQSELAVQLRMWGVNNERADATARQLMCAAMSQLDLVMLKANGLPSQTATKIAKADFYPADWDGFRDYGTDIANLSVAGAYIISEIVRKLVSGEDFARAPRPPSQPYTTATPNMSSEEAGDGV